MNKAVFLMTILLAALHIGAQPVQAQGQNKSQVTIVERTRPDLKPDSALSVYDWKKPGGNPRKLRGQNKRALNSWDEYRNWFLSKEGEKDMWAVQMPADILYRMRELVKRGKWEQRMMFSDGSRASIRRQLIPEGTIFDFLSFGRDKARAVIEKVRMLFSAWARVLTVIKPNGEQWTLMTFDVCANSGRIHSLLTVTPPSTTYTQWERVTSPIPEETPRPHWTPTYGSYEEVVKAPRHKVSAPGLIGPLLGVLGKWLGRPVSNVSLSTGPVQGSSANGGTIGPVTATTQPITVNNSLQQQQLQGQTTDVQGSTTVEVLNVNENGNINVNGNVNDNDND